MSVPESLSLIPRYNAPSSWWEHVPVAHYLVEVLKPSKIIELGTHFGVSYFSFCEAAERYSPQTFIYAIDTWQGDSQAGYYGDKVYERVKNHRDKYHQQRSALIRCRFDQAAERFEKNSIDIIHIDGLHTYEAVKEDYQTWEPMLKEGGSLLFHDWNEREENFGVWKIWEELKKNHSYQCLELPNGHGLGIATRMEHKPDWHIDLEANMELIRMKGKLLSQAQENREEIRRLKEELKEIHKHAENLEIMNEDKETQLRNADSALKQLSKKRKWGGILKSEFKYKKDPSGER